MIEKDGAADRRGIGRRQVLGLASGLVAGAPTILYAQPRDPSGPQASPPRGAASGEPLKLAVLSDMSGILADLGGAGTVTAMTLAIEDAGGSVNGRPIQLLKGDHVNRATPAPPSPAAGTTRA